MSIVSTLLLISSFHFLLPILCLLSSLFLLFYCMHFCKVLQVLLLEMELRWRMEWEHGYMPIHHSSGRRKKWETSIMAKRLCLIIFFFFLNCAFWKCLFPALFHFWKFYFRTWIAFISSEVYMEKIMLCLLMPNSVINNT